MKPTAGGGGPRYQALLQLLRTADTLWNASRALFGRWDLGPSQFNVLNLLHLQPEGVSQIELSRQLVMHRSNLTGLIDRLQRRGLVERKEVAADRRAYRVVLTEAGARLLREILPLYYASADRVWRGVPARRIKALIPDLERIAANTGQVVSSLPHRGLVV